MVLHLGCCRSPYCRESFYSGELFHLKLLDVTRECHGIDIDEESIEFLRNQGIKNLKKANIETLQEDENTFKYDVIVAGEILEHLNNFGMFLSSISRLMHNNSKLIISVPNTPTIKSFLRALCGKEEVHADHVCYFSAKTLQTLIKRFDFNIEQLVYYCAPPFKGSKKILVILNKWVYNFCRIITSLADGIVVVCSKQSG